MAKKNDKKEFARLTANMKAAALELRRFMTNTKTPHEELTAREVEGSVTVDAALRTGEMMYLTLGAQMFEEASDGRHLLAMKTLTGVMSLCEGFMHFLGTEASKTGQLIPADGSEDGLHFAVMAQLEDGSVVPVNINDLPDEDQERLRKEIAEQEAELTGHRAASTPSAGYL